MAAAAASTVDRSPTQADLEAIASRLGEKLRARGERLAVAESCTGGWLAQVMTAIPGSSDWFERGFVTYANEAKVEMLGVPTTTLDRQGAVSEACAMAMAAGVLANSHAAWALAITGIAGPSGGSAEKPVGTVWFAWAGPEIPASAAKCLFKGDRHEVRARSVGFALKKLDELLGAPLIT